jgi:DNA-binding MarR family transcriptional regulator
VDNSQIAKRLSGTLALEIWLFVAEFVQKNGYSPSMDEISEAIPCSRGAVFRSLDRLMAYGCIDRQDGKPRTISILIWPPGFSH